MASSCILEAILPMSHFRIVEVSRPPMSQVSKCCLGWCIAEFDNLYGIVG